MTHGKVLIVDDVRDLAESVADLVEMHGYHAVISSNGQEAIDRFREHDFAIAFMDVRMPVMNGVDSFFEIRKMRPTARIVLMTGFKESIVEKALQHGALGLLEKPFDVSDLLAYLAPSPVAHKRSLAPLTS